MGVRSLAPVLVALGVLLLLGLGVWQLERGAEKRALEAAFVDGLGALPVVPGDSPASFLRVRLSGSYDRERHFLVDNQVSGGRLGYAVISLFRAEDGRRWLINRGFVPRGDARLDALDLGTPSGEVTLVGVAWPDLGMLPLFGAEEWPPGWPKRVPRINLARMASAGGSSPASPTRAASTAGTAGSGGAAVAREIRLDPGQPGVFEAPSQQASFGAERHVGYAVQWFALAAVLAMAFLIQRRRRHD